MKMNKEQINRLSILITRRLKDKYATFKVPEQKIESRVEAVILKNLEEEEAIDQAARRYLEKYQAEIQRGQVDPQKMFLMIKKQIAKEKDFIL
ncbi:MAG: DUF507 family protein [Deltaproteobacteria bacterium]|nr:DUF507 family protein [Deltaproteobacteria bacterium]